MSGQNKEPVQSRWLTITELFLLVLPVLLTGIFSTLQRLAGDMAWVSVLVLMCLISWTDAYAVISKAGVRLSSGSKTRLLLVNILIEYGVFIGCLFSLYQEDLNASILIWQACGVVFIMIGNLMPKISQNAILGVRTK